ncbi:hypothetical protein AGMMS49975_19680 [Clostridia bacterium]|nr:hypothetical protein AGMMS49975_19680 [Clostridia bacterium]
MVTRIRNEDLRKDKTRCGIIDAQSVQNADTASEKGYDAGKFASISKNNISVISLSAKTSSEICDR